MRVVPRYTIGSPGARATEKIDIIGRALDERRLEEDVAPVVDGWFIETRASNVPFSGSSTRTVLSKVEAMREPG